MMHRHEKVLICNATYGPDAKAEFISTQLADIYRELGLIVKTVDVIGFECYITVDNINEILDKWDII